MFFLLRMAFWLAVVCILLPSGGKKENVTDTQIDATQAITLANAAVSDARGFCERQPGACTAGGKIAVALGQKAEAGARTLYEFISTKLNEKSTKNPIADKSASGTLSPSDIAPSWHAPVPLPPHREARTGQSAM